MRIFEKECHHNKCEPLCLFLSKHSSKIKNNNNKERLCKFKTNTTCIYNA